MTDQDKEKIITDISSGRIEFIVTDAQSVNPADRYEIENLQEAIDFLYTIFNMTKEEVERKLTVNGYKENEPLFLIHYK